MASERSKYWRECAVLWLEVKVTSERSKDFRECLALWLEVEEEMESSKSGRFHQERAAPKEE